MWFGASSTICSSVCLPKKENMLIVSSVEWKYDGRFFMICQTVEPKGTFHSANVWIDAAQSQQYKKKCCNIAAAVLYCGVCEVVLWAVWEITLRMPAYNGD